MFKDTKRALRRHHYDRIKKKRQYHWGYGRKERWVGWPPAEAGEINFMSPRTAGIVINTPAPCSCSMCQNPRRVGGWNGYRLTRQELKIEDILKEELKELDVTCDEM